MGAAKSGQSANRRCWTSAHLSAHAGGIGIGLQSYLPVLGNDPLCPTSMGGVDSGSSPMDSPWLRAALGPQAQTTAHDERHTRLWRRWWLRQRGIGGGRILDVENAHRSVSSGGDEGPVRGMRHELDGKDVLRVARHDLGVQRVAGICLVQIDMRVVAARGEQRAISRPPGK